MKKRSNESPMITRKRKSFSRSPIPKRTSLRPSHSSLARPLMPPMQGVVESHILILPTANRKGINETRCMSVPYGMLGETSLITLQGLDIRGGENGQGICIIRVVHPTASPKGIKYQELKANTECLHIETGSPLQTEVQFMFEAVGGSNKGHV
ncbi:hypothetical protein M9H77_12870 [Catharanthus roseus]|uniref:Uncharacterized protein n=1 Tax=Catharanthus roseus TaxID=4058 RepID=A0ACC0BIT7_CATRO|nr:hypothetical protein M9H77_12870 [Catharanthus roseus]